MGPVTSKKAKATYKDKVKVGYYLSKQTAKQLAKIYIKRIKQNGIVSKSSLIEEAIQLLFNQEINP